VIVHQAHRLHERINRRRPHERPATPLEILAQGRGFRRAPERGQRLARDVSGAGLRFGLPLPEERRQRSEFVTQLRGAFRVIDRRLNFSAMADDAGVAEQTRDVARAEASDLVDVEVGERRAKVRAAYAGSSASSGRPEIPRGRSSRTAAGRRSPARPIPLS
jgi:hypothetical protein